MAKRPAARKHTDLDTWQLANQLRRLVFRLTKTGPVSRDFKFRDQIRDAARSACRNTSEGFYRHGHGEFGHLLNVAYGSLGEVLDCIEDGEDSDYFSAEQANTMSVLANRAMVTNLRLRQSWGIETEDDIPPRAPRKRQKRATLDKPDCAPPATPDKPDPPAP